MTLAKRAQCEKIVAGKLHGRWFGDARAKTLQTIFSSRTIGKATLLGEEWLAPV
ncbi:hypothetical protein MESS2_1670028 [Mesorhizobium metallidurans STM 2683]|uniref:Uncharacterized protein n=1 Tax=Mesorhizobium metallidurans STM 2683 TaxID=1297569 RepID=M5EM26_9HYPH|nr:hypothetical protein MESS2_1670028 [Mesorhizobium metallidurans STM 2683]